MIKQGRRRPAGSGKRGEVPSGGDGRGATMGAKLTSTSLPEATASRGSPGAPAAPGSEARRRSRAVIAAAIVLAAVAGGAYLAYGQYQALHLARTVRQLANAGR